MSDDKAPTIAVDLDDVLAQTNLAVAEWHNQAHGTNMTLDDFHYYHYWKNPYWGTPIETHRKVQEFYGTSLSKPRPVPGALEGLKKLASMGYRLVIVTARHTKEEEDTIAWIDTHFPNIFDKLICTGQFQTGVDGKHVHVKISKAQVCHEMGIRLLIDDSAETAHACAKAEPPLTMLLFGDYEWNKRESVLADAKDHMSYEERLAHENGRRWWVDEKLELPENVERVKDWDEVVEWVERRKL